MKSKSLIQQIHDWWYQLDSLSRLRSIILAGLIGTGLVATLLSMLLQPEGASLLLNLGTELTGAAITFYLIDQILYLRQKHEEEQQAEAISKSDLIARLGSSVQSFALAAAEDLRRYGWLTDDSLHGAALLAANLQGVNLAHAQLTGANLCDANLQQADLASVNLREAHLDGANLQQAYMLEANAQRASFVSAHLCEADLREADLQSAELIMVNMHHANLHMARLSNAFLSGANLQGANLQQANLRSIQAREANLCGANMRGAFLTGATLDDASFDERTILPDGTYWNSTINMRRFTHPNSAHGSNHVPHTTAEPEATPVAEQQPQPERATDSVTPELATNLLDSLLNERNTHA